MKKTAIASALALTLGSGIASAASMTSATFTMLSGGGGTVGVDTTVTGSIGGGSFAVSSTQAFFGQTWVAHDGVTFGPGTYSFDTIQGGTYTGVEVGTGQVGGHILFDWGAADANTSCGKANCDIDVVMVWDVTDNGNGTYSYFSTDGIATNPANPDGVRGYGMLDGGFVGFNANFDFDAPVSAADAVSAVPVPAAVWLFGSGLLGLVGVARRKKA